MGFYKCREDYFRRFAIQQADIRHEEPNSVDDATPRQSFFRINNEEEFEAAGQRWIHWPALMMTNLQGRVVDRSGSLRQSNLHTLYIVTKLELDPEMPVEAAAITEAFDITFEIVKELINTMEEDYEDKCGAYFEPGNCRWEQLGPLGDGFYGWVLQFTDENRWG